MWKLAGVDVDMGGVWDLGTHRCLVVLLTYVRGAMVCCVGAL